VVAAVQSPSSEKQQWDVTLVERGDRLCANVVSWQHVRLFSSWTLNVSQSGRTALASTPPGLALDLPTTDADYWTGKEYLERYLHPLGQYLTNSGRCQILLNTEVVSIGKDSSQLFKGDMDHNRRTATSFRTLVQVGKEKEEKILISDAVVDASGSYGNGNWLGLGGLPALGERALSTTTNHNNNIIVRTIPDVANETARYLNKITAVFGSGYSAITTIHKLQELAAASSSIVTVHWCTRRGNNNNEEGGTPLYEIIDNDPLPQRQTLSNLANTLANPTTTSNNFTLVYHPHVQLESIISNSNCNVGRTNTLVDLVLRNVQQDLNNSGSEVPTYELLQSVNTVIANVGYRPDTSIYQELQVHQCYATEGPMKLAAALMSSSGANSVDCLAQVVPGKETLRTSEPSFFIIGMKSYGRSSKFLLSVGHQQVQHVMELLNE